MSLETFKEMMQQACAKLKHWQVDAVVTLRLLWLRYKLLASPAAGLIAVFLLINVGTIIVASNLYRNYFASTPDQLKADASLDEAAIYFEAKTADIVNAPDCFPINMNRPDDVDILYLFCTPEAYEKDGQATVVTPTFSASARIARRYNFWRRIYSLWGEDQYVLHLADYPEVVLEIGDASRLGAAVNWQNKKSKVRNVLNKHRWQYKQMFWQMHKFREAPNRFSPAMRRIARQMEHITSDNKYLHAARNIRVQRGQRDQIALGLSVATRYTEATAAAFVEEGLPQELSLLAFIESSFNLKAYSKVGAAGVYQIMPSTGKQYMIVSDAIDERKDPIKSAHAAAKLLKLNYRILGQWPLAVTAYNHGVGGIGRAVRAVGSDNIEDLIDSYDGPAFGFASKNFFAGFLAIMATITDAQRLFPEIKQLAPLRFKEVRLATSTSIGSLRKAHNLTNEILQFYNPDISRSLVRHNGLLPRGYSLKIPSFDDAAATMQASDIISPTAILTGAEE